MKNYESLDNALSDLREKGYEDDFTTQTSCLYCSDLDMRLDPEDFHVDEIDRVDGNSNQGNGKMLYAISSSAGVKGTIVVDGDSAA
ncbi:hypothetical protein SAMN04488505_105106 [Chitinophaga rupis]|uniref:Phosphoribosylpyrophosphate synthetase n=1 Tax=Chitinophaga rupis TaxID=573321 RepID=A0A1H7ZJ57_9BACT|nr:hypothetical protein [Chitinophaga rupis]SEM58366.1 hypothetical protein SAMN04488505_105106 [Chitinophaga rupis]